MSLPFDWPIAFRPTRITVKFVSSCHDSIASGACASFSFFVPSWFCFARLVPLCTVQRQGAGKRSKSAHKQTVMLLHERFLLLISVAALAEGTP